MTVRRLRAAMTAILLGTAVAAGSALVLAAPAQALTVSAKVGPLLKEAVAMIAAKNYAGAKAKLNEAEAVEVHAGRHRHHQPDQERDRDLLGRSQHARRRQGQVRPGL